MYGIHLIRYINVFLDSIIPVTPPKIPSRPPNNPPPIPPSPVPPPPTILSSIVGLRDCPAPAFGLGAVGLVPFLAAPAIIVWPNYHFFFLLNFFFFCLNSHPISQFLLQHNAGVFLPAIATAQLTYGATILSFLGGVKCRIDVMCKPC